MNEKRIKELESLVLYHKEKYYRGKSEISDEDFDLLENELRKLDPQNPILDFVGFIQKDIDNKIAHDKKMLSLEKTYDIADISKWSQNNDILSIFKIDGSSCSLIYENGHLKIAKTRGDGSFGENITPKAYFMSDIPKTISEKTKIEIRGEVFCIEEKFFELTQEMKALNLDLPNSQRNIVAGILGRKENIQLAKYLSFKAFDVIGISRLNYEHQKFEILNQLGFQTLDFVIHKSHQGIKERVEEAKSFIQNGDYLIDGLVFVLDALKMHDELGETSHHPRYKLAFKFAGETKQSLIESIDWSVSRNGILTPVACISPVELSGAMINRVTLHNFGMVRNFNLKKGDLIEIIRSGEVIPKFLSVVKSANDNFYFPNECPSCSSPLVVEDIRLICKNSNCPAKIKEEILNFISKIGIEDISDKRLLEMLEKKIISGIEDLYKIQIDDLLKLEKVKEKLANKMFDNIQKSKNVKLSTLIASLGIEGLSFTKTEKIISNGFNNLNKFLEITFDDLIKIEGFAEKSAEVILNSLKQKKSLIKKLVDLGLKIEKEQEVDFLSKIASKKICITGELTVPRAEIEKLIKAKGGVIVGSVSKNTDYLLTNETDSTSSKFIKAKALGVQLISENEFYELIEV